MAEDDVADAYFGDDFDMDYDYDYVEDTYPLADELAETSVPDPGYAGTNWELDLWLFDFDLFDFWDDLEYGIDSYWDSAGRAKAGQKRTRTGGTARPTHKRRKLSLKDMSGAGAMFVSMADRRKLWSRRAPVRQDLKSFALLPDWRKRCAEADAAPVMKTMPAEMKRAAEAQDEEAADDEEAANAEAGDDEDAWEDDDDDGGDDHEAGAGGIPNIDLEALQAVLRQKLGEAGLGGMDEGAFMQSLQDMLTGGGDPDGAVDSLADSLLGSLQRQGGDSALSGWLSQHGVQVDRDKDDEDEEDAESVATAELPASSRTAGQGISTLLSPSDSAVEMSKRTHPTHMVLHDGSPKVSKKRSAPGKTEQEESGGKRRRVTFEVPASLDAEPAADAHATKGDVVDKNAVEQHAASETAVEPTRAKANAAEASAMEANKSATTAPAKASEATGPAKSTRKRKAQTEEDGPPPPPPKKQTKKAPIKKSDEQPSYAGPTRATRARSGK